MRTLSRRVQITAKRLAQCCYRAVFISRCPFLYGYACALCSFTTFCVIRAHPCFLCTADQGAFVTETEQARDFHLRINAKIMPFIGQDWRGSEEKWIRTKEVRFVFIAIGKKNAF